MNRKETLWTRRVKGISDVVMEVYSDGYELRQRVLWYEFDNSKVNLLKQINILWYLPMSAFGVFDYELRPGSNPRIHPLKPRCHESEALTFNFRLRTFFYNYR